LHLTNCIIFNSVFMFLFAIQLNDLRQLCTIFNFIKSHELENKFFPNHNFWKQGSKCITIECLMVGLKKKTLKLNNPHLWAGRCGNVAWMSKSTFGLWRMRSRINLVNLHTNPYNLRTTFYICMGLISPPKQHRLKSEREGDTGKTK